MMKYQAHKGVSSENPENTMAAFEAAVRQGYDSIEMDVSVTRDMSFVLLHDSSINRCGRYPDGSKADKELLLKDITFEETSAYDFGLGFSRKFAGTKLPLLEDVLKLCEENSVKAKIDNKFEKFGAETTKALWELLKPFEKTACLTCSNVVSLKRAAEFFPEMHLHYDGPVDSVTLQEIGGFIPKERLTVWLPLENRDTDWVKLAYADEALAELVKKYAELGLWILSTPEELETAHRLGAGIIETNGQLKPARNRGLISDMHTHSLCSHDSSCPVEDMQAAEFARGVAFMTTTDHCDTLYYPASFVKDEIVNSFRNSKKAADNDPYSCCLLTGVELGDGTICGDIAQEVADMLPYDVIIGSVHGISFRDLPFYYSQVDFSRLSPEDISEYLKIYFDQVLALVSTQDMDIMAHLTCPIRYITGKYGIKAELAEFDEIIGRILETIIKKGIALEVNTSSYHMLNDFMPGRDIIRRYRRMGGYLVTLGSDAHSAENAAVNFEPAIAFLKDEGFRDIYIFRDRCAVACRL